MIKAKMFKFLNFSIKRPLSSVRPTRFGRSRQPVKYKKNDLGGSDRERGAEEKGVAIYQTVR